MRRNEDDVQHACASSRCPSGPVSFGHSTIHLFSSLPALNYTSLLLLAGTTLHPGHGRCVKRTQKQLAHDRCTSADLRFKSINLE
ncbi:hypothetical protein BDZ89DRAFT_1065821 [Hymenopellis radicata]|nr:hypothetical protein BDZ89DRAFT_1065821 [Hymenopellis radicata]